ncbi:cation diffusion facilitator family transporter KNAG_0F01770 [Huiozyma naganishii CBS 8797]|uniref:Cation efflux protein transmembrane domain-containing protein n=1 Tax=Huiozyma naganishii (strain ATCC MYA-139 / BCRC 22969 / CBS 8797 / KCTC 17520 / NBRC 10181 / NCYC 3082 / Yp74L-3) TaxID=1071383 RepID=J7R7J7_HUIN7|nr:hypothetical protein KNAG_0F01770 [Kazachstania naganishii CBS 8797]CCK70845.1 hypothetical protein KNAG_0F01770 [Kazachstania naganishii CBS 8797]
MIKLEFSPMAVGTVTRLAMRPINNLIIRHEFHYSRLSMNDKRQLGNIRTHTIKLHPMSVRNDDPLLARDGTDSETRDRIRASKGVDVMKNVLRTSKVEEHNQEHRRNLLHGFGHSHGHSHSHSHSMSNPLLVMNKDEIRKNAAVRITWIGLSVNVGIAVGKFIGGIVFHSQALFADSIHALSDMISDFLTLFSVRLASNKPTEHYPNGCGKIETLGSLAVSTILLTAGFSLGWSALCSIIGPIIPHVVFESLAALGTGHHHESITNEVTDINAAWIAAASIAAKEWIFRATKKIAVDTNSNVLMANAWHHRVDSLTSLVALVTITSGYLFNVQCLDMLGGLIVSGMVVKAGAEGMNISLRELSDKSIPPDDDRHIDIKNGLSFVLAKDKMNAKCSLKDLVVLSSGPNLIAHAEVLVNKSKIPLTLAELEFVTSRLRHELAESVPNFKKLKVEFVQQPETPEIPTNSPPESKEYHQPPIHSHSHTCSPSGSSTGEHTNSNSEGHTHGH